MASLIIMNLKRIKFTCSILTSHILFRTKYIWSKRNNLSKNKPPKACPGISIFYITLSTTKIWFRVFDYLFLININCLHCCKIRATNEVDVTTSHVVCYYWVNLLHGLWEANFFQKSWKSKYHLNNLNGKLQTNYKFNS